MENTGYRRNYRRAKRRDATRRRLCAHQLDWLTERDPREVIPSAEHQRRRQELAQKQHALAAQEKQLEAQGDWQGEACWYGDVS